MKCTNSSGQKLCDRRTNNHSLIQRSLVFNLKIDRVKCWIVMANVKIALEREIAMVVDGSA